MNLKLVRAIIAAIPTDEGKRRLAALDRKDWPAFFAPVREPSSYSNAWSYFLDAQASACVRKLPGLVPEHAVQRRLKAEETFFRCEAACKASNQRLAWWVNKLERPIAGDEKDEEMTELISRMRKRVKSILGPLPSGLYPSFSGGSTFNVRGKQITLPHKLGSTVSVTKRFGWLFDFLREGTLWDDLVREYGVEEVDGNRFTTVDKDSEKDRGICVEPFANLSFQLAIGKHIRRRMYRHGIKINAGLDEPYLGQALQQLLAKYASIDDDFATIDLSDASDTICYMLVRLLLPQDWFDLLCSVRSENTCINDKWVKLQKFSSMGNGFTFELETMLFYVICSVVGDTSVVAVYGDDMIVPSEKYEDIISALTFFGFTPNKKKSFAKGPFRESCGADWYRGHDVRPVFLTKDPKDPVEWIEFHNKLVRIENLTFWDMVKSRMWVINQVPVWARRYGPPGATGVLWTDDRRLWKTRTKPSDPQQRELLTVHRQPEKYTSWVTKSEMLMAALFGVPSTGAVYRDSYTGYYTKWQTLH